MTCSCLRCTNGLPGCLVTNPIVVYMLNIANLLSREDLRECDDEDLLNTLLGPPFATSTNLAELQALAQKEVISSREGMESLLEGDELKEFLAESNELDWIAHKVGDKIVHWEAIDERTSEQYRINVVELTRS